jgi:hypothetical protein
MIIIIIIIIIIIYPFACVRDRELTLWKTNEALYSKTCLNRTLYIPETWTNGK